MRAAGAAAIVAAMLAGAPGVDSAAGGVVAHSASGALPASIALGSGGHRIPRAFFGLSIEYNELATYEQSGPLFARMISLIRPRDGAPMTLRIGGKSADHALWEPAQAASPASPAGPTKLARGVFRLKPTWLPSLGQLVAQEHLRVLLDLNLAVHSPAMETAFAQAVRQALPGGALEGLEIGNEPDEYHFQPPLGKDRVPTTEPGTARGWWRNYSARDYRADYVRYARTLHAQVPGVGLGAPDVAGPEPQWLSAMTGLGRLAPRFLAIHSYASSTCWPASSPGYPTIQRLLAQRASLGLADGLRGAAAFAHSRHMALRLTEVNSVSCGGNRGVANTFATALWAPDALFSMIEAGVNAVSWHIRPWTVNAPFQLNSSGIVPLPELYGLIVFAQMTHGPARVVPSTVSGPSQLNLRSWAVRRGRTVNVLLINKSPRGAVVSLPAHAGERAATVRRLVAPSIRATTGVRWAGMWIGSDGRWHGRPAQSRVRRAGGHYEVRVPAYSAAIVTL